MNVIICRNKNYIQSKKMLEGKKLYKIIGDSCMELTKEMKDTQLFTTVPLQLHLGEETIIDDETFNQIEFLAKMKALPECPKSSCPAPEDYEKVFEGADEVFVITLSSELSGSYNSAMLAAKDYREKHPEVKVAVFDSRSASTGETLLGIKIMECKEKGMSFDEVVKETESFRKEMQTKFVLESLENLRKNGRLTKMTALICDVLSIKPVMKATEEGTIDKVSQARGMNNALMKMVESIKHDAIDSANRILAISHCNNEKRAQFVKEQISKVLTFKEIIITEQRGLSSLYANDGGIIVSY